MSYSEDFLSLQKSLLTLEQQADFIETQKLIQETDASTLESLGMAVNNLRFKSSKMGLYGRILITLVSSNFSEKLFKQQGVSEEILNKFRIPRNKFGSGDTIGIYETPPFYYTSVILSGLVYKATDYKLIIALDKGKNTDFDGIDIYGALSGKKLSILSTSNEITYKRHMKVLERIPQVLDNNTHPSHQLAYKILSPDTSYFNISMQDRKIDENPSVDFYDKSLNFEQKEAITKALTSQGLFLIHGPPGTGKTKTLCELIFQCVKRKLKVLACGPSNISVDNMAERLSPEIKACRIGNPVRLMPEILKKSLDYLLTKTISYKEIKEKKREINEILNKKTKKSKEKYSENKQISFIRKDIKEMELMAIREVIQDSQVIFCTNTTADDKIFYKMNKNIYFDIVIIDEAAQALEISCWLPILLGKKLILAGDHKQLPPTIKSKEAAEKGFDKTLFDRMMEKYPESSQLLRVQYRMNEKIMQWSSDCVYKGMLIADASVKEHSINDFSKHEGKYPVLLFVDTDGSNMGENIPIDIQKMMNNSIESQNNTKNKEIIKSIVDLSINVKNSSKTQNLSKCNKGEADLVLILYNELLEYSLTAQDIGIITPYNAQVDIIKKLFEKNNKDLTKIEISTVDGFQGREKEAIIISMVRSNPLKEIGFLKDYRRMNVAVTRAKRFVGLIGDSETIKNDQFLHEMITYFTSNGEVKMALEYKGIFEDIHYNEGFYQMDKGLIEKINNRKKGNKKKKDKNKKNNEKSINNEEIKQNIEEKINNEEFIEEYQKKIEEFLKDNAKEIIEFKGINSFQRMKVHEIAEKYGLLHKSTGEGTERMIQVMKKSQENNVKIEKNQGNDEKIKENDIEINKNIENNEETKKNLEEKPEIIENTNKIIENPEKKEKTSKKVKNNEKVIKPIENPKKPSNKCKKASKVEEDEDEDEYLNKMIELNKSCNFFSYTKVQCTKNVHLISHICEYCNKIYCMSHATPEIHGCGDKASYYAHKSFKEATLNKIHGISQCKPDEKEYLKMKLQNKIKQNQQERSKKTKDKNEQK